MGTRADFYVGRGTDAVWLGSVAWDGYPDGFGDWPLLLASTDERQWREQVDTMLAARGDATTPDKGWPWPWDDSGTTDYAYAFDGDRVWGTTGARWWHAVAEPDDEDATDGPLVDGWPDMAAVKNVTLGPRSGVIVVSKP